MAAAVVTPSARGLFNISVVGGLEGRGVANLPPSLLLLGDCGDCNGAVPGDQQLGQRRLGPA